MYSIEIFRHTVISHESSVANINHFLHSLIHRDGSFILTKTEKYRGITRFSLTFACINAAMVHNFDLVFFDKYR